MIPTEIKEKIFTNRFSIEETKNFFSKEYDYSTSLIELLNEALDELNPIAIETLMYASSCNGHLDSRYSEIMKKLLLESKILNHNLESVAESLQFIKDPTSIESLYQACQNHLPSDIHSIPLKAMWAIRDIGTEEAKNTLLRLTKDTNPKLKKIAIQQLAYFKERNQSNKLENER